MRISLINAILLPLAMLALIPLLVHLFARSRPPRYAFSSVEFIRRILKDTMRMRRPQDWIALALRTLFALALIALFLRPVLFGSRATADPFERRNVVLVVDRSASMGCMEGGQTRFASACAEASELIAGLSAKDRCNIIWLDANPDAVFHELGANMSYLQQALRRATVSNEAGAIEAAIAQAVALLTSAEGHLEINLVSDFQASAWENLHPSIPETMNLVFLPIAQADVANVALVKVSVSPSVSIAGETVIVSCEVANYSEVDVRHTVYAELGESRQNREITLPPWQSATVSFACVFEQAGEAILHLSISEDAFAGDNDRFGRHTIVPHYRAALVAYDEEPAATWRRALDALGQYQRDLRPETTLPETGDLDALLISGWKGEAPERLIEAAESGCAVIVSPASGMPLSALSTLAQSAAPATKSSLSRQSPSSPNSLRLTTPDDPVFEVFESGAFGDPGRGAIQSRLAIPRDFPGLHSVLLGYDDGVPALARLHPSSALYLWNLPVADGRSTWIQQGAFVPLFGELLASSRRAAIPYSFFPGSSLSYESPSPIAEKDLKLLTPSHAEWPQHMSSRVTGVAAVSDPVEQPGIYTWQVNGQTVANTPVNFPPIESDLRPLAADALHADASTVVHSGREAKRLRDGIKLWPFLLGLAALALTLETLFIWHRRPTR